MTDRHEPLVRPLNEAVVFITGGSSGIGLEGARQLAQAGVPRIFLVGRDQERGQTAAGEVMRDAPQCDAAFLRADVTDATAVEEAVSAALGQAGRIDVLINAAGGDHAPELFHEIDIHALKGLVNDYFMGALHCSRAVLPSMMKQRGGSIINVASDAAKQATPGETVIGGVMAGLVMFSRTLALEAKRSGVRVNCLTPSIVEGTRTYDLIMSEPFSSKLFAKAIQQAQLGVATPADLAAMIVYLASPASARMTGQAISINGGISAA
jgi:NAD(P)-dependent dehydrogenase (short-subunit alcohol dehydrogenase family)